MDIETCKVCEEAVNFDEEIEIHERRKNILIIIASGLLLFFSITTEYLFDMWILGQIFAAFVVLISGYEIMKEGILKLIKRKITINILMTVAAIGSFIIGHGGEGAGVMFLFFLAEFLEDYASDRSKKSVSSLMKIAPDVAMIKRNGVYTEIHTHDVKKGEIMQVKPGDNIPLDGRIIRGASSINEASLTGESIPIFKQVGDEVFAGTVNFEGYLEIEVTTTSDQTLLAKIKRVIDEARSRKSKTERFIDEFAKYYTPMMIFLAISIMVIPPLLLQLPVYEWIYRGLTLLVISCPCALALSTPISMVSALTSGAKQGILIKGGQYIEELNKVSTFAFDKTGTLTEGALKVKDIISYNGVTTQWMGIVAGLEALSEHPISKAIVAAAEASNIIPAPIHDFKAITGKGVTGALNGRKFYVGNMTLFQDLKISIPEEIESYQREGKTVVLFGDERNILGLISLQDTMRKQAKFVIKELKARKIQTVMISGDNKYTVRAIQRDLGIDEGYFELKPQEKQKVIKKLFENVGGVAMVGNGVNDAPALATANVGIAMGGIGSATSLETADIILMKDDLGKLLTLLDIGTKTGRIVKENIYFAISVKLLFVILTFLGLMTLWMAVGIADLGVTLIVILNAYRISFVKKTEGEKD
ncbi:MAG: heavy metal translocating P-type ATPase [Candidatus Helarchaeota archaeon]